MFKSMNYGVLVIILSAILANQVTFPHSRKVTLTDCVNVSFYLVF